MLAEDTGPPRLSAAERTPAAAEPATDGGGGTTFAFSEVPMPPRTPSGLLEVRLPLTLGGGGTTFAFKEVPLPPLPLLAVTDGGGGTTSVVPKSFPSKLLTNDPLPVGVGGGGTTVLAVSGMLPLASRCRS
jgi:hypothetical protein